MELQIVDETIFVILHNGFTNFIVYKDVNFTKSLSGLMIDYMFKMCGETETFESQYFHWFMSLNNTKK